MGIKKFNAVQGFSVGQNDTIYDVIDSAANVTANNLTVNGTTHLGAVANVSITGGTDGYVLRTDGLGNLSWENPADVGVVGSNTEVQFNDNGLFGASANFTFNNSTKTLTVDKIVANGIGLTNVAGANVSGTVANANYAAYSGNITIAAQPNITSVGTLVSANITGNLKAGNANLGNMATANYYTGTLVTSVQPNITSVGTLDSLAIDSAGSISGANLVSATYLTGTLTTKIQPNITSVGTLVTANITGNLKAGNANLGNLVTANFFGGNGSLLTDLNGSNVTGQVGNALIAGTVYTNAQPNITSVGILANLRTSGNITSGNNVIVTANVSSGNANLGNLVTANYFSGDGSLLINIDGVSVTGQVGSALIAGTVTTNAQPNITSVGILANLRTSGNITSGNNVIVTANVSANNANLGNLVTANYFSGNGSLLTALTGANVTGTVALATHAVVSDSANSVTGANVTGQVASALIAGTVTTSAQPNITSVGTLVSANVSGNITSGNNVIVTANVSANNANLGNLVTANYFSGDGSLLTNIIGTSITSQVANALTAGTVYTNAQPNITSVGTLVNVNVSGNITSGNNVIVTANVSSGNANLGNLVTANYFTGNGSLLTNLNGSNVTGQVANALIAGTVYTNAQPNITSVGTLINVNVSGNITSGNNVIVTANVSSGNANLGNLVTANYFSGAGNLLSNIVGGNVTGQVANALIATTVTANAQPNITSVGTLVSLAAGDTTITGNLTVTGSFEIANVSSFSVKDPIIEQGGNTTGSALTSNDGFDRGQLLHYYSGSAVDAFMGWDNSNAEFAFGSNVSVASEQVTFNSFGNVRANYFLGNASQLIGTIANANYAAYAGNVTVNAQPNITSVGTLTSLTVASTGNITSGNANLGNLVTANYFTGNGSLLTNLNGANVTGTVALSTHAVVADSANSVTGANVTGQVASALIAGTVTTNAQPNITSVGTLSSLTIASTGNITSGNANLGNLVTANYFTGNGSLLTNLNGSNVTGQVANALIATTITANAQPNITSVGTLSSLTVASTGNITSGNANLGNLVTANYFTGTLTTNAQPNITRIGSLSGLTVSNTTGVVDFTNTANVSLGSISNLHISGGTSGYVLKTDGSGTLSWVNPADVGVVGSSTQVQFNDGGHFGASANFTFDKSTNTLSVTGQVKRNNLSLMAFASATSAPSNPIPGDEWYDQLNDTIYKYITDGVSSYWIDTTSGYLNANVSATANSLVQRDANGNITANFFIGDGSHLTGVGSAGGLSNGTSNINAGILNGNITVGIAGVSNTVVFTSTGMNVIATGGINAGNLITANYLSGNGSLLTSLTGANVTGTVANATYAVSAGSATTATSATTAATVTTNAQPNITSVGTLVSTTLAANANITASGSLSQITGANLVSANYFSGSGNLLSNIQGANVTGTVSSATTAGTVTTAAQPNITSVGTLVSTTLAANANITMSGSLSQITGANLVTANYHSGNGSLLTSITGANVTGTVANATYAVSAGSATTATSATTAGTVTTNAQPNITSVGTLASTTMAANANITMSGSLSQISGANLVSATNLAGNLTTALQPNITSVGTLANLAVTGNITTSGFFKGDGGFLSNVQVAAGTSIVNGTSNVATGLNANVTVSVAGTSNTVVFTTTGVNVAGYVNATGNVSASYVIANGSALSSITGSNVTGTVANATYAVSAGSATTATTATSATTAGTVTTAAQPNITSVGTLVNTTMGASNSLTGGNLVSASYLSGTLTTNAQPNITSVGTLSGLTINGNLTVSGNFEYANVTSFRVQDPLIEQGGNVLGGALTSNDGFDRGQILHYYSGSAIDAFMGWDNSNAEFAFGSNVSISSEVVTFNNFGNIRANYFLGNASQLVGTIANANYAAYAGNLVASAQPNITSVGTLASTILAANANITMSGSLSQISGANLVSANYYSGNGSLLTSITGANVTGTVANATYAISAGSATTATSATTAGSATTATSATTAGTVTTNAQPNITSVGTLTNLTSGLITATSGGIKVGNIQDPSGTNTISLASGNVTLLNSLQVGTSGTGNVTATYFIGNGSQLTGLPASYANSNVASYLPTYTGTVGAGNVVATGNVTASYVIGNGSQLTGMYSNTNVASYLPTYSGLVSAGNVTTTGNVTASYLIGNGSQLTGLPATYANSNVAAYLPTYTGNIAGNIVTLTGNISAINANLGNLVTANYYSGVLTTNAQPNITSVGTLANLSVTSNITTGVGTGGSITGANLVSANYFTGVLTTNAQPNITSLGTLSGLTSTGIINFTGASNVSLGSNANVKITGGTNGQYLYTDGAGNLAWATIASASLSNGTSNVSIPLTNGNVIIGSGGNTTLTVTPTGANVTGYINATGNVTASYLIGNGSQLTGLPATYANSNVASYLPTYSGLVSAGNVTATGNVTASYLIGNGSQLTGLPATYANSNVDAYLPTYTGNITGNIVTLTGNITAVNANLGNLVIANYFSGAGNLLSNIQGGNVTGQVANALIATTAGTVTTNAQPNITSVGTLSNLTSTGTVNFISSSNVSLGPVSNVRITGGSAGYVLSTDGSGTLGWIAQSGGGGSGTVTASPYITKYNLGTTQSLTNGTDNIVAFSTQVYDTQGWFNTGTSKFQPTIAGYYKITYSAWFTVGTPGSGNQYNIQIRKNGSGLTIIQEPEIGNTGQGLTLTDSIYLNGGSDYLQFSAYPSTGTISLTSGNGTYFEAFLIGSAAATSFIGNANSSVNIASANANITFNVNDTTNVLNIGNVSTTLTGNLNVTANVSSGANITAAYLIGNGSQLTGLPASYTNTNVSSYLGTFTGLVSAGNVTTTGNVTASYLIGNGSQLTGLYSNTNVASYLPTYSGLVSASNVTATGNVTASYLIGNGSQLTGLPATYANSNVASYLPIYTGNITGNIVTLTGNVTAINANLGNLVTANYFTGNGSLLSSLTGANVTGTVANATYAISAGSATTAGTVTTNAQPNITRVGTLTDLTISGNLTVGGATEYTNVTNLYVKDPIIEQGGAANAGALSSNDGKDRGQLLHYYSGSTVDAFMGWDNSNAEFAFGSNVSVASEVVTFNNFGNVRANYFLGNASQLVGTIANANYAAYAGVVTATAQPNISSVGTLTGLTVSGTLTVGNTTSAGNVTAAYFIGAGNLLSNIVGGNVTGQVANALIATTAGTVTTNAQPNITSVGTLTGLTSTSIVNFIGASNVSLGSNANVKLTGGTSGQYLQTDGTGNLAWATVSAGSGSSISNGTSNVNISTANGNVQIVSNGNIVANVSGTGANITGTLSVSGLVTATASGVKVGNIQDPSGTNTVSIASGNVGILGGLSVGTSGSGNLSVSGKSDLGAAGNVKITGGTTGQFLKTDGAGNLSWASASSGGSSLTYTAATTPPGSANVADQWFNTTTNVLYEYMNDGSASYWVDIATPTTSSLVTSNYVNHNYTGDGTTTGFTVTLGCGVNDVLVFLNGVCQSPTLDYTITNTTLTLDAAPTAGTRIQIRELPR